MTTGYSSRSLVRLDWWNMNGRGSFCTTEVSMVVICRGAMIESQPVLRLSGPRQGVPTAMHSPLPPSAAEP